jgi:hypothetical protein
MAERLTRSAITAGMARNAAQRIADTFISTVERRSDVRDERDPAHLHPARNALILLEDVHISDPLEIRAAIAFDSMRPAKIADDDIVELLQSVPVPSDDQERLLEDLVVAAESARRIAVVDRLDHARHLHLMPVETWPGFHAQIVAIYLPAAERTHPLLAARMRRWADAFARRRLPAVRT